MIRVLIVEDEEIIRKGLINTIDWIEKDCNIVGEAINGLDGLEKIRELKPDLVITDIKMPNLNGLEMIKRCQSENIVFESILLTSYGEFEYAKEGINIGVVEYLLKPLDEELLYKALDKVKQKLENKKNLEVLEKVSKTKEELEFFNINICFEKAQTKNKYVYKALQKIQNRYNEKISIIEIADELGVSSGYLSRKFKEELEETFLEIERKCEFKKYFDGKVVSYDVKLLKPEKEIYEEILKKYNLNPEETLFIDDTLANTEGAEKLGISTIHLINKEKLKEELEKNFIK